MEDDANSAERVGGMFKDIIEKSKDESGRKLAIKDLATSVGYSTETSLTQDAATRLVSEYNVSINHPTAGVDETNRYTLSEAIAKVPAELRNAGVKVSFLDESGSMETWEFQGESWAIGSFSQVGAGKLTELENEIYNTIGDNPFQFNVGRIKTNSDEIEIDTTAKQWFYSNEITGLNVGDVIKFNKNKYSISLCVPQGNGIYVNNIVTSGVIEITKEYSKYLITGYKVDTTDIQSSDLEDLAKM